MVLCSQPIFQTSRLLVVVLTALINLPGHLSGDTLHLATMGQVQPEGGILVQWNDPDVTNLSYTSPRLDAPGSYDNDGYHYASTARSNLDFNRGVFSSHSVVSASTNDLRPGAEAGYATTSAYTKSVLSDNFVVSGLPNGTPVILNFIIFLQGEVGHSGGGAYTGGIITTGLELYSDDGAAGIYGAAGTFLGDSSQNGRQAQRGIDYSTYAGLTGNLKYTVVTDASVDTFANFYPPDDQGVIIGPKVPDASAFTSLDATGIRIDVDTPGATLTTASGLLYNEDPNGDP